MTTRKVLQFDPATQALVAEYANPKAAAEAVGKSNGDTNILLCCGNNHLANANVRKAYGFYWRFSD